MIVENHSRGWSISLDDGRHIHFEPMTPTVCRVRSGSAVEASSLVVISEPKLEGWKVTEGAAFSISSEHLEIALDGDGRISFSGPEIDPLALEAFQHEANGIDKPGDDQGLKARFKLGDDVALYGLGQHQELELNWRGRSCTLIHGNVTIAVPCLVSTGGWGLLWDNASHTEFSDGSQGMELWSEVSDGLDFSICVGNAEKIHSGFHHLSGRPPLFPRAFYGFIQCKERYKNAEELIGVVVEHRRRELPLDVIVQDWQYWGGNEKWSSMVCDPEAFGDLDATTARLKELGVKNMFSIWPVVGHDCDLHRELAEKGHLFPTIHWTGGLIYDAFSQEARDIYWRHAKAGLFERGVQAWWMDGTEPEFASCHDPLVHKASLHAQRDTAAGSWARVLNAFSLVTTQGVYEGQREASEDQRVFILTRSGFIGQQRYAAAAWSGDISSSWDTLRRQIPAGLNYCAAGLPYWTTDNGAFFTSGRGGQFPEGVKDPAFREFFVRWFQWSVFCPLMRSHGTQTPREIWQFGEPGEVMYDAMKTFLELRMRLLPYHYSQADRCTREGGALMEAMGLAFPGQKELHDLADQHMDGPALMVAPVTQPMVHFPADPCDPLSSHFFETPQESHRFHQALFDGIDQTQAVSEEQAKGTMDFNWTGSLPAGVTGSSFRVELSGRLTENFQPRLRFQVAGRLKVWIDGEVVIDEWENEWWRDEIITLPDQQGVDVVIHYGTKQELDETMFRVGWDTSDQQSHGEDVAQEREVVLPEGHWFDFWNGEALEGGQKVVRSAGLDEMPVLVKAGSILPLGPVKAHQGAVSDDEMEVRIYPGANGSFVLYEDEGDGYAYEKGVCSRIPFRWEDSSSTLHIGSREGSFPGMLRKRRFHLVLADGKKGGGVDALEGKGVVYEGEAISLEL